MRIDRITLHHLRMPLVSPFETSFGRVTARECILVEVDSEGLAGYGECVADYAPGYAYETAGTAWHVLSEFLCPALLGKDVDGPRDFRARAAGVRGHPMAKASVEMALWDLLGKRQGRSLRELLGGERERVDVGVSVGLQDSPAALVETVGHYLEQGYRRIKIKIKPGRDVGDAQAVRAAFPDIRLQVDANSAYTLETAEVLLPLDDLDLLLIEQPLFEACRIINIKAPRVGGLTEAVAVHNFCRERGLPVWCGGMLETGVGRASNLALASLPGFVLPGDISASDRYYRQDITNERFVLNDDSTITVPTGPGLGVTVDMTAVKAFALRSAEITGA